MNPRQQRFVQEYLLDPNATQAAIRAGYSQRTARSIGQENLTKPDIRGAIERAQAERAERTSIKADDVVGEWSRHAFGVIGDFFDKDTGHLLKVSDLSPEAQARVASIEVLRVKTRRVATDIDETVIEERVIKIKLWDKMAALNMLGKHLGMFRDRVEHGADFSLLDALRCIETREAARARKPTEGSHPVSCIHRSEEEK